MATATRSRARTKKPVEVVEDLEEEDLEVEEDEDEEPVAKKRPAKKAAPKKDGKGIAWLRSHINETLGTDHETSKLRAVLRKLIKDGTIESPKEGRYIFQGPNDQAVKGLLTALKAEAKAGPAKRGRKPKSAKISEDVEDLEEDVEDLELDDEDE